jgi:hypothetical protein
MYYKSDKKAINAGLMKMGLWKYRDEKWAVRPAYHAYAQVTPHTLPGSKVFDVAGGGDDVDAVALRSPKGVWTLMIASRARKDRDFVLVCSERPEAKLERYLYGEKTLPAGDELIPASGSVRLKDGKVRVRVPARSFMVLKGK